MLERVVTLFIFGVGAAVGLQAAKAAGGGVRPVAREAVRAGLAATETLRSAATAAGRALAEVAEEARREYEQEKKPEGVHAKQLPPRRERPRKIDIVRE